MVDQAIMKNQVCFEVNIAIRKFSSEDLWILASILNLLDDGN